jgi:hypothetical protein
MTVGWVRLKASAIDAVSELQMLLQDNSADDRRLIAAYLESKRTLAEAFEALSVERYVDLTVLKSAKSSITLAMQSTYPRLPARYLKVRGYGSSHARLLSYLCRSTGAEVSGAELRMLTGDAVHTERRTRELRDLGFNLEAKHTSGTDVYILRSDVPDTAVGAAIQVKRNIREDRATSKQEKDNLMLSSGLT